MTMQSQDRKAVEKILSPANHCWPSRLQTLLQLDANQRLDCNQSQLYGVPPRAGRFRGLPVITQIRQRYINISEICPIVPPQVGSPPPKGAPPPNLRKF